MTRTLLTTQITDKPLADNAFPSVKHFARRMMVDNRLLLGPLRGEVWSSLSHKSVGDQHMMTAIVFRSGCWQVELLCIHPGSRSPLHRHNHCDSADILLNGDLQGRIDGEKFNQPSGSNLAANIQRLPLGAWHGGTTQKGLIALSFQKWIGMEPTFIANDWEAHHGN